SSACAPADQLTTSEGCTVQLADGSAQDVERFGDHFKGSFGASWKELWEGQIVEGEIALGSPVMLSSQLLCGL
ncbi:unnamed protein product, partial [Urochloa humidicola]